MLSHQNKREALVIGDIFYSLGYNVKIALFNAPEECDTRKYDIIFGLEPNFVTMSQRNPQALKIYYATGAYWKHQLTMVKNRTDLFNTKHGDPAYQHHGLAEMMMQEVIDQAEEYGMMISLETHNPKNVAFYEHLGFKTFGVVEKAPFHLKQYCMIRELGSEKPNSL